MKFWKELKRRFKVAKNGFSLIYNTYFTSEGQTKLLDTTVMNHGGKRYLIFDFPIIAKTYSSIEELYNEDKARKVKKSKANDKKGRTSKKASN